MEKRAYIKFGTRLLLFCAALVITDRILGFAFKQVYFHQRIGQFSQTTYAIDSARQDVMIFGSSRAVRDYSSPIIAKRLGLSCYNSGRDGMMIPYSSAVEQVTLEKHKPKLIILDIAPRELSKDNSKYEKLSILLPYCGEHQEFLNYVNKISPFEPVKLFSKTYPYNSSIFILGVNSLFPKSVKKDSSGYLPLDDTMTKAEMDDYQAAMQAHAAKTRLKKEVPEEKAIAYYREFLDRAKNNGVKTLVVIAPTILKDPFNLDNQSIEKKLIIDMAREYPNVTFLDFSSDPRFNYHPEKFADMFHLNKQGSEEYSGILAKYIRDNVLNRFVTSDSYKLVAAQSIAF